MKNKLAYLGFLGFIGVAGILFGTPTLGVFLLFFFFFFYANMVPDELFKSNLRLAGLIAAASNLVLSCIAFLYLNIYNIISFYRHKTDMLNAYDSYALAVTDLSAGASEITIPGSIFLNFSFTSFSSALLFIITLCVFMFSLAYFHRREERDAREC